MEKENQKELTFLEKAREFENNFYEVSAKDDYKEIERLRTEFISDLVTASDEELADYQDDFADRMKGFLVDKKFDQVDKRKPIFRILTSAVLARKN